MAALRRQLAPHRGLLSGFLGYWLIPLVINLATDFLIKRYGATAQGIVNILLFSLGVVFAVYVIYRVAQKEPPKVLSIAEQQPPRFPGLVVNVGKQGTRGVDPDKLSHIQAIEYHLNNPDPDGERLRYLWLVATKGETGTVNIANELERRYKDRCKVRIQLLQDGFDIQEMYEKMKKLQAIAVTEQGLSQETLIFDFTGGTSPMSAGMVLACGSDWPMQYYYGGRSDIASTPLLVRFKSDTARA